MDRRFDGGGNTMALTAPQSRLRVIWTSCQRGGTKMKHWMILPPLMLASTLLLESGCVVAAPPPAPRAVAYGPHRTQALCGYLAHGLAMALNSVGCGIMDTGDRPASLSKR
jgi:hypothetical protein